MGENATGGQSLWVWDDVEEVIGVTLDSKIEPPAAIHARLPDVAAFIVLLGIQRAMPQVAKEMGKLLAEGALHLRRCTDEAANKAISEKCAHVPSASRRAWRRSLS